MLQIGLGRAVESVLEKLKGSQWMPTLPSACHLIKTNSYSLKGLLEQVTSENSRTLLRVTRTVAARQDSVQVRFQSQQHTSLPLLIPSAPVCLLEGRKESQECVATSTCSYLVQCCMTLWLISQVDLPGCMVKKAQRGRYHPPFVSRRNNPLLHQRTVPTTSGFFLLPFSLFLYQKDMTAEIIPERSRINTMRKRSLWKASYSPAVCNCEKLSNWAAGWG